MNRPKIKAPFQTTCGFKAMASELNALIVREACDRFFDSRGMPRNGLMQDFRLDASRDQSVELKPENDDA